MNRILRASVAVCVVALFIVGVVLLARSDDINDDDDVVVAQPTPSPGPYFRGVFLEPSTAIPSPNFPTPTLAEFQDMLDLVRNEPYSIF
jgi:hypothetical protein